MGLLIDGVWRDQWYDTQKHGGEFVRENVKFHHWVTADGRPGPAGEGGFKAEPDRYHLYISYACPWSQRTLIFRALKRLEKVISFCTVEPHMLENGWEFAVKDGATSDPLYNYRYLYQLYLAVDPRFTGRVTVPVLWDKAQRTLVNNSSPEIIRMLNSAFAAYTDETTDYYPEELRGEIDRINQQIYEKVNNGVYRCGFATSQRAYEKAFDPLFETLDELEERLSTQRYLSKNAVKHPTSVVVI